MPTDNEKMVQMLTSLAGSVLGALKGTPDDRARLVVTLNGMDAQMPAVSEDTADAKEFIRALVGLLEGNPPSAEGMGEPYKGIYSRIVTKAMSPDRGKPGDAGDKEMREFLTQIAASVVMIMRTGEPKDKVELAARLREVHNGMPEGASGPRGLLLAMVELLEGRPGPSKPLPEPYAGFFQKVRESIARGSH
ncbi:MAG: hypothetical protein HZC51_04590 [Nitrospirae bacterium]|nr:hypothetical protein [Nitrospirota bacterium]